MKYKLLLAIGLLGAAAAGLYAASSGRVAVVVTHPMRGPAVEAIYATGHVEPVHWAKVAPLVSGRLAVIFAREGVSVTAGTVLARLDDREARARVAERLARVEFLRAEFKRQAELFEETKLSRQSYERVTSELKQAEAELEAARQAVADREIVAPLDGIVLRKEGEIGEAVDKGLVLFWVGQPRPLRVTADVDEEDIPRCRVGQRALIKADAFPARVLEGRVSEITPLGDPINKSYRVRISLPPETPLLMGMTTEINIIVAEEPAALLVPADAVVNGYVWIVQEGAARRVPVHLGVQGKEKVQILEGLQGHETLIVHPPAPLEEGNAVRIQQRVSP